MSRDKDFFFKRYIYNNQQQVWEGCKPVKKYPESTMEAYQDVSDTIINCMELDDGKNQQLHEIEKRQKMDDSSEFPYTAICLLTFKNHEGNTFYATASMIGKKYALTAAHNLYNIIQKQDYKDFVLYPGFNGEGFHQNRKCKIVKTYIPKQFLQSIQNDVQRKKYDYAVIELQKEIHQYSGYFGIDFKSQIQTQLQICGYPGKIKDNQKKKLIPNQNKNMFRHKGHHTLKQKRQKLGDRISYQIQTSKGQSGSAVFFRDKNGNCFIIGVHTDKNKQNNQGVHLDKQRKIQINKWIGEEEGAFSFRWCDLNDQDIKQLTECQDVKPEKVVALYLTQNPITDKAVDYICEKFVNLQQLQLNETNITDKALEKIKGTKWNRLRYVNLENTHQISEQKKWQFKVLNENKEDIKFIF